MRISKTENPGRTAGNDGKWGNIFADNSTCANNTAMTDMHSLQKDGAMGNPDIILDEDLSGLEALLYHRFRKVGKTVIRIPQGDLVGNHHIPAYLNPCIGRKDAVSGTITSRAKDNRGGALKHSPVANKVSPIQDQLQSSFRTIILESSVGSTHMTQAFDLLC